MKRFTAKQFGNFFSKKSAKQFYCTDVMKSVQTTDNASDNKNINQTYDIFFVIVELKKVPLLGPCTENLSSLELKTDTLTWRNFRALLASPFSQFLIFCSFCTGP